MNKKVRNVLLVFVVLLVVAGAVAFAALSRQHNLRIKLTAKEITEDQPVDISFWHIQCP